MLKKKLAPPPNPNYHHSQTRKLLKLYKPEKRELLQHYPVDEDYEENTHSSHHDEKCDHPTENPEKYVQMMEYADAVDRRVRGEDIVPVVPDYRKVQGRKRKHAECTGDIPAEYTLEQARDMAVMKQKGLSSECGNHGLSTCGTKIALSSRLVDHYRLVHKM